MLIYHGDLVSTWQKAAQPTTSAGGPGLEGRRQGKVAVSRKQ